MLTTFGDFKRGPAKRIAGVTVDSKEFLDYTNDAARMLIRRGSWWGTVQPMQGCVTDNCVVWPRYVGSVLAVNVCGRPINLDNHWYQFMQWGGEWDSFYRGWRGSGRGRFGIGGDFDGTVPVFANIPAGYQLTVRCYCLHPRDKGKKITIFGYDQNNQWIRSKRQSGTIEDGVELVLTTPYIQTNFQMTKVERIHKDETVANVPMYMVDSNDSQIQMADYAPSETSPEYIRMRLRGHGGHGRGCGYTQISALVALAFHPVRHDSDLVVIENLDAMSAMIQSIRKGEAGDAAGKMEFERLAFRELNYEMRKRFPDEQFKISFRPFGNDNLNGFRVNAQML